ncbi:hypothetical protein [Paenibacillus polymyxa]|uniref:hypothetical protein n=1 Tax=Paenibacillus polymyxa TaxID=1406 RepID=UPI000F889CC5|nr:hypothetical protein [Paenibacillus polymyxa]QDA26692.1 hypothetical protein FGY93_06905 [Paenibacillus polymyxa]RTZ33348.1 hypothetical protein EJ573_16215 [Paenibacillus polymyxa]
MSRLAHNKALGIRTVNKGISAFKTRDSLRELEGTMIVPAPKEAREEIDHDMKKIRINLIQELGQAEYDRRIQNSNKIFKDLMNETEAGD